MAFPIIHTNFWDGVIAVPLIVVITQFLSYFQYLAVIFQQSHPSSAIRFQSFIATDTTYGQEFLWAGFIVRPL